MLPSAERFFFNDHMHTGNAS